MANKVQKTEGGQGGRRGHSNMTHWQRTEDIKAQARKARRVAARQVLQESQCGGADDPANVNADLPILSAL